VFGSLSSGLLETEKTRKHPIEFDALQRHTDVFEIKLPPGYVVDDMPPPVKDEAGFASYRSSAELKGDVLSYTRTLEINEVVLDVLGVLRHDLSNRGVAARTELAADLPAVNGDPVQLQQVLLNLIMNGCDAMNGALADRRLTLRTALSADGEIQVSVTDRGRGIPPADMERIFEPFVSTKAEGMGLGLSICRTIVTAHRGQLWAVNNADRGASFHFTVPAERGPSDEQPGADRISD